MVKSLIDVFRSLPQVISHIFARLQQDAITVDILVNNAGIGVHGAFAQTDLAKELEVLQVNIEEIASYV